MLLISERRRHDTERQPSVEALGTRPQQNILERCKRGTRPADVEF